MTGCLWDAIDVQETLDSKFKVAACSCIPCSPDPSLLVNSNRASDAAGFNELLRQAKSGDEQAAGELYEACRKYLLLIANQDLQPQTLQKIGASDVVQQSLLVANRKIGEFRGTTRGEFFAWMRQILLNECRQSTRHFLGTEKRNASRELLCSINEDDRPVTQTTPDPNMTPSTNAASQEQAALVREAMLKLPKLSRQVIELRNWQELTFDEIGWQIGKSSEAARKVWARGVLALESELRKMNAIE